MRLENIPIEKIDEGERAREEYGDLSELVSSIKENGLIQPIAVLAIGDRYKLLAGGRRLRAIKEVGFDEVPCRIYENISEVKELEIELEENVRRVDLTWQEKARLCKKIHNLKVAIHGEKKSTKPDAPGWSKRDTARLLEKSPASLVDELAIAEALETFPEIAECKTKDEAKKRLAKINEELVLEELNKRIREQRLAEPQDLLRKRLSDSYIIGDFLKEVKKIPNQSVDLCEVDPPYGIDLGSKKKSSDLDIEDYNEISKHDYPSFMRETLRECFRVLKQDGWLILWFAPEPWYEYIVKWVIDSGFQMSRIGGLWVKSSGQSRRPDLYLANCYEPFFYARKGNATIKKEGRTNVFLYNGVSPSSKIHPTERPIELMEDILSTFLLPGSRVLVPFLGSGNTLLACANLGMEGFGYDLSKSYKDSFVLRVFETPYGQYKSYRQ